MVAPLLLAPKQAHSLKNENKNVSFLDASWFMPDSPRRPRQEFISKRIPGAQFLDLDEVSSPHELGLKHMMPEERVFADACEKFGIEKETHVVIYDTHGVFSSPRALFMFRTFGHQRSSILDGGLPAWLAGGFPVESGALSPITVTKYATPKLQVEALRSYEQIVANSTADASDLILDARSYGRYSGLDPEPRPGLSSGHIPNSLSLPFNLFLRQIMSPDGTTYTVFLSPKDIRKVLEQTVGLERADSIIHGALPVTTSCGSGMTAGILWLGLKLLGVERISLYDESWTGYAMRPMSQIEKSS
ncbi:Putative 3-mercaptopyruvate sulfurtransferase [Termitomyces sp. J132]|nr:Putative 3-mercaptopyruvate sulfurtransferase [Termitomyces sp. J132]